MEDLDVMIFKLVANGDKNWQHMSYPQGILMAKSEHGEYSFWCRLICNDGIALKYISGWDCTCIYEFDICSPQFDPADLVDFILNGEEAANCRHCENAVIVAAAEL